jgi:putative transposase
LASHDIPPTPGPHVPLREATAYGVEPKYLIRDNDDKFGVGFARVAQTSRIEILTTPYFAPRANAICERFLLSVRRECLDHLFILHEKQLHRVLHAYLIYFNLARPHQGIKQKVPGQKAGSVPPHRESGKVVSSRSWVACIVTIAEVPEFFQS